MAKTKKSQIEADLPPTQNGANGTTSIRDTRGRFVKGHPGGPGRPPGSYTERNLQILQDLISEQHVRVFIARLYTDALAGDALARQLLVKFVLPSEQQQLQIALHSLNVNTNLTPDQPTRTTISEEEITESLQILAKYGITIPQIKVLERTSDEVSDDEMFDELDMQEE